MLHHRQIYIILTKKIKRIKFQGLYKVQKSVSYQGQQIFKNKNECLVVIMVIKRNSNPVENNIRLERLTTTSVHSVVFTNITKVSTVKDKQNGKPGTNLSTLQIDA